MTSYTQPNIDQTYESKISQPICIRNDWALAARLK